MYALIKSGGKQYRVSEGDVVNVELLRQDSSSSIVFDQVLFVSSGDRVFVGAPFVSDCTVKGDVLGEKLGKKVIFYRYKRRKNYRRKVGHRQKYSEVRITGIEVGGISGT